MTRAPGLLTQRRSYRNFACRTGDPRRMRGSLRQLGTIAGRSATGPRRRGNRECAVARSGHAAADRLHNKLSSDDPEQPQNEDQDQKAAKTDIHRTLLLIGSAFNQDAGATFQTLRERTDSAWGIILPLRKVPDLLDFQPLTRD